MNSLQYMPRNCQKTFWDGKLDLSKLGGYVYALMDPRNRQVFYIGLGGGKSSQGNNRPDDHLQEASDVAILPNQSRKIDKIREIWAAGCKVDLVIVRHGLPNDEITRHVESACIDLARLIVNETLTNQVRGHGTAHSIVSNDNFKRFFAEPVNPNHKHDGVWLFNISNAINEGRIPYDAVRQYWTISSRYRRIPATAVGLVAGISRVVVEIDKWEDAVWNGKLKCRFSGQILGGTSQGHDLLDRDFRRVITNPKSGKAWGYFVRGGVLSVNFLGDGRAEIVRGVRDRPFINLE